MFVFQGNVLGGSPAPDVRLSIEIINSIGIFVEVGAFTFPSVPPGEWRQFNPTFSSSQLLALLGFGDGLHTARGKMELSNTAGSMTVYSNVVTFQILTTQVTTPTVFIAATPLTPNGALSGRISYVPDPSIQGTYRVIVGANIGYEGRVYGVIIDTSPATIWLEGVSNLFTPADVIRIAL